MAKINENMIVNNLCHRYNAANLPADEVQLNLDVLHSSILDEVCSVVPMDSPRQIISTLRLKYGSAQKAMSKGKDVVDTDMFFNAMPLDENGYVTDNVKFEVKSDNFISLYKCICPNTIAIAEKYIDDGKGNIIDSTSDNAVVGTVDYIDAVFKLNPSTISDSATVQYKVNMYGVNTNRNKAYFSKSSIEIFANIFKLDLDSAIVLQNFKGLNIKDNIKNIIPQVLSQQIDSYVLNMYFKQLKLDTTYKTEWDATVDWSKDRKLPVTKLYEDFGTLVSMEMGLFSERTGVVPNIILCDPITFGLIKVNPAFSPLSENITAVTEKEVKAEQNKNNNNVPKKVGLFGDAKVFLVKPEKDSNENLNSEGKLVITYKGDSDAQTAGVYAPFIPVSLRSVEGSMEDNMLMTNNVYSISGFAFSNPELISGVIAKNVNLPTK